MKKKKLFIIIPLLVILVAAGALFGFVKSKGIWFEKGYIIKATNGSCLYVTDNGGPVRMTDMSKGQKMFDSFKTGDRALIAHDAVQETYPGSTAAYFCKKLSDGDESNISKDVISTLTDLGWLSSNAPVAYNKKTKAIEAKQGDTSMVVDVPEDWQVKKETDKKKNTYSILLTPTDSEGTAEIICYPEGGFGVCGTGLNTESILGGTGTVGYYDNSPLWNFIIINKGDSQFVTLNNSLSKDDCAKVRAIVENGIFNAKSEGTSGEYMIGEMNVRYTDVGYSEEGEKLFRKSAAPNKYQSHGSKRALPTAVIRSKKELNSFLTKTEKDFSPYGYFNQFNALADEYKEEFFESKVLLVTYITEGSGSISHEVKSVSGLGDELEIHIETISPEAGTCDMAAWLVSMEFPKGEMEQYKRINTWA